MCILFSSMYKVMQVIWAIISPASGRMDCTLYIESFSYSPHKGDKTICIQISNSYSAALAQIHVSTALVACLHLLPAAVVSEEAMVAILQENS